MCIEKIYTDKLLIYNFNVIIYLRIISKKNYYFIDLCHILNQFGREKFINLLCINLSRIHSSISCINSLCCWMTCYCPHCFYEGCYVTWELFYMYFVQRCSDLFIKLIFMVLFISIQVCISIILCIIWLCHIDIGKQ